MNIENFIEKKQLEIMENKNFQKWNENNKLKDRDGYPIISFHGSTNNDFNIVDLEQSQDTWWCGKGFYTSSSIEDVNANYATGKKKFQQYSTTEDYTAGDLRSRISNTLEDVQRQFEDQEDTVFFTYSDIENYLIDDEYLDLKIFNDISNPLNGYEFDKSLIKENNTIEISKLFNSLCVNKYIKNNGWVKPIFVKMENPAYYTLDHDSTKISIVNDNMEDFINMYESEHDNVVEMINDLAIELSKLSDIKKEDIEENIKQEVNSYVSSYVEDVGEDMYDCLKDYIEMEFKLEEEEIIEKLNKVFSENNLGEYDEDNDEFNFEHVVILNLIEDENEEAQELYKKIKESTLNLANEQWDYEEINKTFSNFEIQTIKESGDYNTSLFNLFKAFRHHPEEPDLANYFNDAIKENFDGIVLDAMDSNEKWNLDIIGNDTKHYIVFNNKNIKSAIGNNGKYSINDPDIAAKRSVEQIKNINIENNNYILEQIEKYNERYENVIKISIDHNANNFNDNEQAVFDRKYNEIYLNINKIKDSKSLSRIISHEIVGHAGLDLLFGKHKNSFLDSVGEKYKKQDYKEVMKLYPELDYSKKEDKRKLTEEKICFYAENNYKNDTFMNKVVNKIKNKYSQFKRFFGINKVEDDIFQVLHSSNQNIEIIRKNKKRRTI
jgi:hypothetical protein